MTFSRGSKESTFAIIYQKSRLRMLIESARDLRINSTLTEQGTSKIFTIVPTTSSSITWYLYGFVLTVCYPHWVPMIIVCIPVP